MICGVSFILSKIVFTDIAENETCGFKKIPV